MAENKITANIKKIKFVLEQNLSIPHFQRPYVWIEDNVRLLLQDIYDNWKSGKQSYRIGSAIFYEPENEENLQIVDGQQRITSILLILRLLNNDFVGKELCESLNYEHSESTQHIAENNKFIEKWIAEKVANEKNEFYKYIVDYCEFVEIIVADLSEAFQMFDSQNGRGKELEAYNLLKAYHIRAMEGETQETKIESDRRWESATKFKTEPNNEKEQEKDILKQVINEQLYRTRKWSRKEIAYDFTKSHIKEFKGIAIDNQHTINFPFQNPMLLQYISTKYFESIGLNVKGIKSRFANGDSENINPFVLINQNIINGKQFFDYIETYVEIYKRLFVSRNLQFFKNAINTYCPRGGRGNEAMYELFKSLVFLIFDKFGEKGIVDYWATLYSIVYRIRLQNTRNVNWKSVAKYPQEKNLFSIIENAKDFSTLQKLNKIENETFENNYKWRQAEKIKQFFKDKRNIEY
ncbi:MAG: DUF262 domain-containing protein [Prevotellaceae bacterium]|jgi:hypothetical protein|nr:DUF262 domain-containing protein [Prevotellaceae bacterium]